MNLLLKNNCSPCCLDLALLPDHAGQWLSVIAKPSFKIRQACFEFLLHLFLENLSSDLFVCLMYKTYLKPYSQD